MKRKWLGEMKGNVSFIDLGRTLGEDRFYARDGVHLNDIGNARMGGRLREWMKEGEIGVHGME